MNMAWYELSGNADQLSIDCKVLDNNPEVCISTRYDVDTM